jgi:hypothetical protein
MILVRRALPDDRGESLAALLGGRRGALDASLPAVGFIAGWLLAGWLAPDSSPIAVGCVGALAVALAVAIVRLVPGVGGRRPPTAEPIKPSSTGRGSPARAALIGLAGVAVAAVVALRTGRAVDFFLVQVLSNAASALAWASSIVVRWPLLGLVVGAVLGQRTRWRRDPALLRAYLRASWVWVGQYLVRLTIFVPLYLADQVVALAAARVLLSWPLITACLAISWWVLRRSLPPGHPGLRHPQLVSH